MLDIWNNDGPPNQAVDTSLVGRATLSDLYEDNGEHWEKLEEYVVPFGCLPVDIKEEYIKKMKGLELVMKNRNEVTLEEHVAKDPNLPIRVRDQHRHERIKIPWHPCMKKEVGDTLDQEKEHPNPYSIINDEEEQDSAVCLLNERYIKYLLDLTRYDAWEGFILPKILQSKRKKEYYETSVGDFSDTVFRQARLEIAGLELRRYQTGDARILMAIQLDDKDLFYVCVVFLPTTAENKLAASLKKSENKTVLMDTDYRAEDEKEQKDLELVKKTGLRFERYFYFTCGCGK